MLKKNLSQLILGVSLLYTSSISQAETWNQYFNKLQTNGIFEKQVAKNYKDVFTESDRAKFDLHYSMKFSKLKRNGSFSDFADYKEDYKVSFNYSLGNNFNYLNNISKDKNVNNSFKKAISNLVNTDCGGISCFETLKFSSKNYSSNLPNKVVLNRKWVNLNTSKKKEDLLFHLSLATGYKESRFRKNVVSSDGAGSFFQFMPCTAKSIGLEVDIRNYDFKKNGSCKTKKLYLLKNKPYDSNPNKLNFKEQFFDERFIPSKNIDAFFKLFFENLKSGGKGINLDYTLAMHNGGMGGINKLKFCRKKPKSKVCTNSRTNHYQVNNFVNKINKTYKLINYSASKK